MSSVLETSSVARCARYSVRAAGRGIPCACIAASPRKRDPTGPGLTIPQDRIAWRLPSLLAVQIGVGVAVLLLCVWAVPLWVGFMTQLRPELPAFARAPRTIVAAGNYEAHRLLYSAAGCVFVAVVDVLVRIATKASWGPLLAALDFWLLLGVCGCAALGWIGPARSDYTLQLVRTRGHAVRIVIMYGFFLGPAMGVIFLDSDGVILLTVH